MTLHFIVYYHVDVLVGYIEYMLCAAAFDRLKRFRDTRPS